METVNLSYEKIDVEPPQTGSSSKVYRQQTVGGIQVGCKIIKIIWLRNYFLRFCIVEYKNFREIVLKGRRWLTRSSLVKTY
jgi:hypothetical protein